MSDVTVCGLQQGRCQLGFSLALPGHEGHGPGVVPLNVSKYALEEFALSLDAAFELDDDVRDFFAQEGHIQVVYQTECADAMVRFAFVKLIISHSRIAESDDRVVE